MVVQSAGFNALPNELFIHILECYPTRRLLPMASVSRRFHDAILSIIYQRLLAAASLQDHHLVLECFHPTAKFSTPSLHCDYIGTDSLGDYADGESSSSQDLTQDSDHDQSATGGLSELFGLYSHFRPRELELERRPRRPHPAGDIPGHTDLSQRDPAKGQTPYQTINLESHELFTQLCSIVNLVKVGSKRGLFVSCVTVEEGVIRVWRDWLAQNAVQPESQHPFSSISKDAKLASGEKRTLWLDLAKTVGIRLRVIERQDLGSTPVILRRGEDPPVTYTLEYEELVVKTSQLLMKIEESLQQEANHSGKALVINWRN